MNYSLEIPVDVEGSEMKWGLVGASDIAETRMIEAMRQLGHDVVGVMSSSPERGAEFAERAKLERSTTSLDEMLSWDIDAVYISTTNELHAPQAIQAARAGKHILSEKPLAMSSADAKEMISEAESHGVVLATNHHLRCAKTHGVVRDLIASGKLGKIYSIQVNHAVSLPERLRGWRLTDTAKGAGVVLDITVHNLDLVRFLLGEELISVMAANSNRGFSMPGVPDESLCIFASESGVLVSTHESFNIPHSETSVEVFGSEGTVFAKNVMSQDPVGEVILRNSDGVSVLDTGPGENLYVRLLRQFDQAVNEGGSPASSGFDGMMSMAGAIAALKSAEEGRRVNIEDVL